MLQFLCWVKGINYYRKKMHNQMRMIGRMYSSAMTIILIHKEPICTSKENNLG